MHHRWVPFKKSFLKTVMVMSFMGWIYTIAYQFAFPVGITEGHPLAHSYPLALIRMDDFGIICFVLFGVTFFLWNFLYVDFK